jgi:pimeloyl-ACP methyl ester carboxylesterase
VSGRRPAREDGRMRRADIVLVHGAMHGAWCWEHVVPFLRGDPRTATVRAVDLPGDDDTTLDDCVDHVVEVIEQADLRNLVMVGHSLGGITITPAANRIADRIQRLVYLTTICPPSGATVFDLVMDDPRPEMKGGMNPPDMFCTDFDDETRSWLVDRLRNQPALPLTTPIAEPTPPPSIPCTYILCERDEALTTAFQAEQAERVGATIVSIDAGHSPFATHPAELAALILRDVRVISDG